MNVLETKISFTHTTDADAIATVYILSVGITGKDLAAYELETGDIWVGSSIAALSRAAEVHGCKMTVKRAAEIFPRVAATMATGHGLVDGNEYYRR